MMSEEENYRDAAHHWQKKWAVSDKQVAALQLELTVIKAQLAKVEQLFIYAARKRVKLPSAHSSAVLSVPPIAGNDSLPPRE